MACTAAIETEIDRHYAEQHAALADADPVLSATIAEFQAEEVEHRDTAIASGAERAPGYPLLSADLAPASKRSSAGWSGRGWPRREGGAPPRRAAHPASPAGEEATASARIASSAAENATSATSSNASGRVASHARTAATAILAAARFG